jgi:hypothetical protein
VLEPADCGFVPAMMNRHPLAVTQQNHVAALAEYGIKPVDLFLSLNYDILQRLARETSLASTRKSRRHLRQDSKISSRSESRFSLLTFNSTRSPCDSPFAMLSRRR